MDGCLEWEWLARYVERTFFAVDSAQLDQLDFRLYADFAQSITGPESPQGGRIAATWECWPAHALSLTLLALSSPSTQDHAVGFFEVVTLLLTTEADWGRAVAAGWPIFGVLRRHLRRLSPGAPRECAPAETLAAAQAGLASELRVFTAAVAEFGGTTVTGMLALFTRTCGCRKRCREKCRFACKSRAKTSSKIEQILLELYLDSPPQSHFRSNHVFIFSFARIEIWSGSGSVLTKLLVRRLLG